MSHEFKKKENKDRKETHIKGEDRTTDKKKCRQIYRKKRNRNIKKGGKKNNKEIEKIV